MALGVGETWHLWFLTVRPVDPSSCLLFHSLPPDMPQSVSFPLFDCIKWTVFTGWCLGCGLSLENRLCLLQERWCSAEGTPWPEQSWQSNWS